MDEIVKTPVTAARNSRPATAGDGASSSDGTPRSLSSGSHPGDARNSILAVRRASGELRFGPALPQKPFQQQHSGRSSGEKSISQYNPLDHSDSTDSDESIVDLIVRKRKERDAAITSTNIRDKTKGGNADKSSCASLKFRNAQRRLFQVSDLKPPSPVFCPSPAHTAANSTDSQSQARTGSNTPASLALSTSEETQEQHEIDKDIPGSGSSRDTQSSVPLRNSNKRRRIEHPTSPTSPGALIAPASAQTVGQQTRTSTSSLGLPVVFDAGASVGRVWCPLNMNRELDGHWKVFPPNEQHPQIPGEGTCALGDLGEGDSTLPAFIHHAMNEQARNGVLFTDKITGLANASAIIDNCGFDVEDVARSLRTPASLRRQQPSGFRTGQDPFVGAGPVWIKRGDSRGGVSTNAGRVRAHDGVFVPPVLPSTTYHPRRGGGGGGGGRWTMSDLHSLDELNHDLRRRNPRLRWVDVGNGAIHLVDGTRYPWVWRDKEQEQLAPVDPTITGVEHMACESGDRDDVPRPVGGERGEGEGHFAEAARATDAEAAWAARSVLYLGFFSGN